MPLSLRSVVSLPGDVQIPRLGVGVYQVPPGARTRTTVLAALDSGYRHVDTAAAYGNEAHVGAALRDSGVPREQVFVTTKLRNEDQGYDAALRAFDEGLRRLGLTYVDLYLIHFPVTALRSDSWRALEEIARSGRSRAIGVSNYTIRHLEELLAHSSSVPTVNQVEFHPFLYQRELLEYCRAVGVQLEAYSPLARGQRMDHPVLVSIGRHHGKTPAQVLIRWALQHDLVVIPKSARPERIRENATVFDFALGEDDMARLDALGEGLRTAWDPTDVP